MMEFIAIRTEIATNMTNAAIRVVFTVLQSKQHILFAEKRCFYVISVVFPVLQSYQ